MSSMIIFQDKVNFVTWRTKSGKHIPIFGRSERRWTKSQIFSKHRKDLKIVQDEIDLLKKNRTTMQSLLEDETDKASVRKINNKMKDLDAKISSGEKRRSKINESLGVPKGYKANLTRNEQDAFVSENWGSMTSRLSDSDISSLRNYQGTGFKKINSDLRNGIFNKDGEQISNIISKSRVPENIVTYRAFSRSARKDFDKGQGSIIRSDSFLSTSLDLNQTNTFLRDNGMLAEIRVKKDTKGFGMSRSKFASPESEILLQRGQAFRVIGRETLNVGGATNIRRIILEIE